MKRAWFLACLLTACLGSAWAATPSFPDKRVRVVIPFPPGQGSDILARAMSEKLAQKWGQPVVVENKAGANGAIAVQEVARSQPDGHTLLLTSNSPIVINPALYKNLSYSPAKDLAPVALLAGTDMVMVANKDFPAKTLPEVIAELKANPGKYSYGTPGTGSTSHLSMEVFKQVAGVDIVHVPYKGSAQALTDLIGGSIKLMIDAMPSALPQVRGDRVRPIAITSSTEPSTIAPEFRLAAADGVKGLPGRAWYGVFAPKATPPEAIQRLVTDINDVMQTPEIMAQLPKLGLEAVPVMSPAQFGEFLAKDSQFWVDATKRIGIYHAE